AEVTWGQSARVPTVATLARTDRAAQKGHRNVRSLAPTLNWVQLVEHSHRPPPLLVLETGRASALR
ncbi:MAG: hypothetical protein ACREIJ_04265, partial [Nitrospiraceae bacterium]